MTPERLTELERLARAARDTGDDRSVADFRAAADPATVLALVAEINRLRENANRYRHPTDVRV